MKSYVMLASAVVALIAGGAVGYRAWRRPPPPAAAAEERTWVEVKRIRSGDRIKVEPDDEVIYAGIRAPLPEEPLYEQSKSRNAELVAGRTLRLRFDVEPRDKKQRLAAYAYADDVFVNAALVREGLAWVRLTSSTRRHADELLAAQREARRKQRGIWKSLRPIAAEVIADPKYGLFHATKCAELSKIDDGRQQRLVDAPAALELGFAPCGACRPQIAPEDGE